MDRLTELRTFLAVVDHGSFAAAARSLRRSPPTITRIVAEFEGRLGVRLFDRSSRRCTPTKVARRLAEASRNLLADYDAALGDASGQALEPRGMLRVTAPYVFGRQHVAPLILDFVDAYPEISCELDLSDRQLDLVEDMFDIALRIGTISDLDLVARKVGFVREVIAASPDYLRRNGEPSSPSDLQRHQIIQQGPSSTRSWRLRDASGRPLTIPTRGRFTVNQADAAIAAAREGRGLVAALSYQVFDDLKSGALALVLEQFEPEPLPVHLVWPEGRDRLLRVRMLIDYLAPRLQDLAVLRSLKLFPGRRDSLPTS